MDALPNSVVLGRLGIEYNCDEEGNTLLFDEDGMEFILAENYEVLEWAKRVLAEELGNDAILGDITLWGRRMYADVEYENKKTTTPAPKGGE